MIWSLVLLALLVLGGTALAQSATPTPTPQPDPEATEEPLELIIEPAEGQEIPPPIEIDLPDAWQRGNGTALVQDVLGLQLVPFTVYTGPVSDGTGFIVVLWGFESTGMGDINFDEQTNAPVYEADVRPYLDALRLLRFAVIGTDCVPGIEPERDFSIGGETVRGANFSAYQCDETFDTRGWFLGTRQDGLNFAFYMYTEPIDAMTGDAPFELQTILDTIDFQVQEFRESLPTVTPTPPVSPTPVATATPESP